MVSGHRLQQLHPVVKLSHLKMMAFSMTKFGTWRKAWRRRLKKSLK